MQAFSAACKEFLMDFDNEKKHDNVFTYELPVENANRQTRDSIFTDLFHRPKYALQLFKVLHPEITDVTEDDITAETLKNVLATGYYNDLGLLVKDRLLILVEAQSSWNPNMAIRCLLYLADTYQRYISKNQLDLFGRKRVMLPKPEFYVVYTGGETRHDDMMRLSDHFCDDEMDDDSRVPALQLQIKMLYNSADGDILHQYVSFCRKLTDELASCQGSTLDAIRQTIRDCQDADILAEYLREHQPEVEGNMIAILQDDETIMRIHDYNIAKDAREEGEAKARAEAQIIIDAKDAELNAQAAELTAKDAEIARLREQLTLLSK